MAIICTICNKKQSGWIQDFPLSNESPNLRICAQCFEQLEHIRTGRGIDSAKIYFEKIFSSVEVSDKVREAINQAFLENEQLENEKANQKNLNDENDASDYEKKRVNSNIGPFENQNLVYTIDGVRGRHIDVYKDKVVITVKATLGSLITHNATDGEKTVYYSDCIGVQFKQSKFTIGYLQLETASSNGNHKNSNFFDENSFTFDTTVISNEKMTEVANYVKTQVDAVKKGASIPAVVNNNISVADELLKLKQLLDIGVLTQEEFDKEKNKLLNR